MQAKPGRVAGRIVSRLRSLSGRFRHRLQFLARPSWPWYDFVLAYSEHHFKPGTVTGLELTSAGQIASHIYHALGEQGTVLYTDRPRRVRCRVLISGLPHAILSHDVSAQRRVSILASGHPNARLPILLRAASAFALDEEDAVHSRYPHHGPDSPYIRALQRADILLGVGNQTVRQTFMDEGILPEKLVYVNYGTDFEIFSAKNRVRPCDRIVFIHVATDLSNILKGTYYLLDAWRRFYETTQTAQLWVLGPGQEKLGAYSDLPGVTFHGPFQCGSAEHASFLCQAHYIVSPSLAEGQVGALIEGMSCGCVPIATRESGIDADEFGGWVIGAASTESLVGVLFTMVESHSPDRWAALSERTAGRIRERHSWAGFEAKVKEVCGGGQVCGRDQARPGQAASPQGVGA